MIESLEPREDFPILERIVYMNQASIGLIPAPVTEEMQRFEQEVARNGTYSFDDAVEAAVFDNARRQAAELIGAEVADIAVITSATEALCQLAWWRQPSSGANVVATDLDFPSVTYPWLRVCEQSGAEVRLLSVLEDPQQFSFERVAELVDDQTDVICISHVQYATGHRLDLQRMVDLAGAHDALLIIDATQSAGVVPIDVGAIEVDVVLSSAYKWLSGPTGAAFCYMRPELREGFRPPFVGWRGTPVPFLFDAGSISLHREMRRMEYSTVAYGAGLGLGHAVRYLMDHGIEQILSHSQALCGQLIEALEERGARILTPQDPEHRAGIVAAVFPEHDAGELTAQFAERDIYVASRLGAVRFSCHGYNDESDVERVIEALDQLAR